MQYCSERDYFGYGIGGSLGQNLSDMHKVLEVFQKYKKPERPVHLLGMGGFIKEIFEALPYGIDTFDCVHPTRVARHGLAMGRTKIDIRRHTTSQEPLDRDCPCMTCSHYSRAALHILYRAGELTALVALAEHNVATMVRLMSDIRTGLANDSLQDVRKYWCGG
jgi:queuine tRNA-ribosyltransferase